MSKFASVFLVLANLASATIVHATETITYTYDARGRIVQASHAGTVNNGIVTTYSHDVADNRKQVTTTGAAH